jgi:hypothetical protein
MQSEKTIQGENMKCRIVYNDPFNGSWSEVRYNLTEKDIEEFEAMDFVLYLDILD